MSGPLRRTQRSRPADAGEPFPEGQAAETEGAAPTAETPHAQPETAGEPPASADTTPPNEDATPPAADASAPTDTPAPTADATPPAADANAPTDAPTLVENATPPAADAAGPAATSEAEVEGAAEATPAKPRRPRWRPFRRRRKAATSTTPTPPTAPVLLADPDTPAGVDPAEAPMRPPAGRRGRLRRRLRYLRRARELMLRDLGGLLYEVHRSGGGKVEAHATVVGAKVQRIAGLDAEARALETALAAPRSETVVFEPGVGGTCATCGELYGSDARFCANCGAAIGAAPAAETKPPTGTEEVVSEPARRAFWRRAARPAGAPSEESSKTADSGTDESGATPAESPPAGDEPTAVIAPRETAPTPSEAGADEGAGEDPSAVPAPDDDTAAAKPDTTSTTEDKPAAATDPNAAANDNPSAQAPGPGAASPGEPRNPYAGLDNGRPDGHEPPELSPGDPLMSRKRP